MAGHVPAICFGGGMPNPAVWLPGSLRMKPQSAPESATARAGRAGRSAGHRRCVARFDSGALVS